MANSYTLSEVALRSAYTYIKEYNSRFNKNPSGLLFNKFMILFNRRLLDLGKDMKLPHCWYRWGDEVISYAFRNHVYFNHDNLQHTEVRWIGNNLTIRSNASYQLELTKFTEEFIENYSDREGSEDLLDDVYGKVPFSFQNEYRKVRENLKISRKSVVRDRKNVLKPLFEKAMATFPKEFKGLIADAEVFRNMFLKLIESDVDFRELEYFSEDFWFWFCYHLRIKCCYNASHETIAIWKEVLPNEDERFKWRLQDVAYKYLSDSNDSTIKGILEIRKNRMSELSSLIDQMPELDF